MAENSDADTDTEGVLPLGADTDTVYEVIFGEMDDAVFFVDVERTTNDYRFTFRRNNASHQQRSGFSDDQLRGQTPRDLLSDEQGGLSQPTAVAVSIRENLSTTSRPWTYPTGPVTGRQNSPRLPKTDR